MTADPKPGDMAYIDQPNQHGAVVRRTVGDTVWTIDGNSDNVVRERMRSRRRFTAFYSIDCLLPDETRVTLWTG